MEVGWVVGEMRGVRCGEFGKAGLQARCQTSRRGEAPLGGSRAEESRKLRDAFSGRRGGRGMEFGCVVGEMRGVRCGEFGKAGLQARCQTSRKGEAPLGGPTAEESRWVARCHASMKCDGLGSPTNPLRFLVQPRTSSRVVHSAKSSPWPGTASACPRVGGVDTLRDALASAAYLGSTPDFGERGLFGEECALAWHRLRNSQSWRR